MERSPTRPLEANAFLMIDRERARLIALVAAIAVPTLFIAIAWSRRSRPRRGHVAEGMDWRLRAAVSASPDATLVLRLESNAAPGSTPWRIVDALGGRSHVFTGPDGSPLVQADLSTLGWDIDDLLDGVNRSRAGLQRRVLTTDGEGASVILLLLAESMAPGLITLIVRDVTADEVSRAEREREFAHRLSALAMGEHQIKTPLSAAAGWAELLASDDAGLDAATKQHAAERVVTIITRTIRTINEGIDDLGEQGRAHVAERSVADTGLLLALSLHAFKATLDGRTSLDAGEGMVVACPSAVYRQIIDQLLENSAKYSPAGRTITVATRREDEFIITSVTDEGIGIPDGSDIFAPYVRGAPKGTATGSGLGLHIVRTLAERHGGSVKAWRNAGEGSTFEVRLPSSRP